jgi:catechol 2,3-dioxygenase-like lactoylglutathione lyase family enzyme
MTMQSDSTGGLPAESVKRVSAITLFTDDLAEAKRFYRDVFAMPVVHEDETSVAFAFPNVVINLVVLADAPELIAPAPVGGPGTPSRLLLTVQVDDVDAACERLRARGVNILNGPMTRPWGPRTAAFADPSGHCWELSD